jgi:hypothetical protein
MITADKLYEQRKESLKEIKNISTFLRKYPKNKNSNALRKFLDLKIYEFDNNIINR